MYLFDTDVLNNLKKRSPSCDLLKRVDSVPVWKQFTITCENENVTILYLV